MGKKGKASNTDGPEAMKELGNKAFAAFQFSDALKHYSSAIELSSDSPNHVYYSNRANCFLELQKFAEAILDCDKAIELCPSFAKSYYRKGKALLCLC